jgi:hypothetical protein
MADFEKAINDAIAAEEIPGCALAATNRDGTVTQKPVLVAVSRFPF